VFSGLADTVPPSIISESLGPNATSVGLSAPIVLKFSELLNPSTVNNSTVTLQPVGGGSPVAATVTDSGSTVTLTPSCRKRNTR
jgi:hypothetical protein